MRSALLAVLTRLLFPLADEDLGVQHEHFRQRLFELPAEVHALAHRIDPQLGNMLDPLFAMDHEGERPEGVTLAVGTVAGRLRAKRGGGGGGARGGAARGARGGGGGGGGVCFFFLFYKKKKKKKKKKKMMAGKKKKKPP